MGKIKRRLKKQAEHDERCKPPRSRLNHPVEGWTGDLPERAENCGFPPKLIRVNALNDVWMEIPRYVNFGWGGHWLLLIFMSAACLFAFYTGFSIFSVMMLRQHLDLPMFLSVFFGDGILLSMLIYFYKSVLFEPRGAPVRFNRKRQKVYVYEFQKSFLPWKRWHPVIKVFDWKDIHGEWEMRRAHADWGHRIYCAVCRPGTYEVVDRFVLTWTVGGMDEAGGLWSFCRHYMEKKPVPTAPVYTDRPRDWTPFRTVQWPADITLESTTAPGSSPEQTDREQ